MNLKVNIALTKLAGATLETDANGNQYIAVPVEPNNIFVTDKGGAYLSLVCWENSIPDQKGNTHSMKVSYPKDDPRSQGAQTVGNVRPMIRRSGVVMPYQQTSPQYPGTGFYHNK